MRSHFRSRIICVSGRKRIEVLEGNAYLLHADCLPDCYMQIVSQILTCRLFYPPLFSFFMRPHTLANSHTLLYLTEQWAHLAVQLRWGQRVCQRGLWRKENWNGQHKHKSLTQLAVLSSQFHTRLFLCSSKLVVCCHSFHQPMYHNYWTSSIPVS